MPITSEIATLYVNFATKGNAQVAADAAKIKGSIEQANSESKKSPGLLDQFRKGLDGIFASTMRIAKAAGGLSAGFVATFAYGAARGTVEADHFGQSLDYLVRTIGDAFAPYVRKATDLIGGLAMWFQNLSAETKDSIAQWALIGAGIGAVVVALPILSALLGGLIGLFGGVMTIGVAAFAVLTSPITLTIAAIAGLVAAFAAMLGYFDKGSAASSNNITNANKTWVDNVFSFITTVTTAFAKFFNWLARSHKTATDGLAFGLAQAGEKIGLLPKGTVKTLYEDINRTNRDYKPPIDIGKLEADLNKVKDTVKAKVPVIEDILGGLGRKAMGIVGIVKDLLNVDPQKAAGGFQRKFDVSFESFQGYADRLSKAFSGDSLDQIPKEQLETMRGVSTKMDKLIKAVGGLFVVGE